MTPEQKLKKIRELYQQNDDIVQFAFNSGTGKLAKLIQEIWKVVRPEMERVE